MKANVELSSSIDVNKDRRKSLRRTSQMMNDVSILVQQDRLFMRELKLDSLNVQRQESSFVS
jgi:hypothetical protein